MNFENIIVRMPNWIGDLVMATPILADIKRYYPNSKLTAMCQSPLGDLLQSDPNVDEIFSYSRVNKALRRVQQRDVINKIRAGNYDLGVVLPNSFSSAWWFFQGKVQTTLGFKGNLRSPFLTHARDFPESRKKEHLVETYKKLLAPLGIPVSSTMTKLYVDDEQIHQMKEKLKTYGVDFSKPIIGINPGAAYGSAKCWPEERFREIAKRLSKEHSVIFFGTDQMSEMIGRIVADLPRDVIDLSGRTTLREMSATLKLLDGFLTNDSGPMHMADSLLVPTVALFGSTDPVVTGPYRHGVVINKNVDCAPCFKRVCPIDFRCMKSIEVDEVEEKLNKCLIPLIRS